MCGTWGHWPGQHLSLVVTAACGGPACRTEDDIAKANSVDLKTLRDPQPDNVRVKIPEVRRGGGVVGWVVGWLRVAACG